MNSVSLWKMTPSPPKVKTLMELKRKRLKPGMLLSQKTGVSRGKCLPLIGLLAEAGEADTWVPRESWQLLWRGRLALNVCQTIRPQAWALRLSLRLVGRVTLGKSRNLSEPSDFHLTNEGNETGLPCRAVGRVLRELCGTYHHHLFIFIIVRHLAFTRAQWGPVKGFPPGAVRLDFKHS